jgi:hypothetical protein
VALESCESGKLCRDFSVENECPNGPELRFVGRGGKRVTMCVMTEGNQALKKKAYIRAQIDAFPALKPLVLSK